jgi:hypothetical protein
MKINVNIVLLITAVIIAPLTLSNCIVAIDAGTSSQAKKLLELEESRIKGTISNSQYKTQKNELMKPSNS